MLNRKGPTDLSFILISLQTCMIIFTFGDNFWGPVHKTHHHYRLPYTDANFGNIFSIWDRLFGTYLPFDREKIVYGVDVFFDEKENGKIKTLLKQPFQAYSKPTLAPETES